MIFSKLRYSSWALILWAMALTSRILFAYRACNRGDDLGPELGIALQLVAGHGFKAEGSNDIVRYSYLPPGLPSVLAGYIKLFGMNWLWFHIIMVVLGTAACWLIYLIGRELLPETYARVAAFWLALYPPQIFWSSRMNPKTIASHLLILIALLLISGRAKSPAKTLGIGALWGILTLFRGEYLLGAGLIAIWILWFAHDQLRLILTTCFLAGFVLTLSPWLVRNWRLHHRIVMATNLGDSFYQAFNPRYDFTGNRYDEDFFSQMAGKSEIEIQDRYLKAVFAYIRSDPWILPRTLTGNFIHFWRPYLSPKAVSWKENILYTASYAPVFIFFLIGICKIPWKHPGWALVSGLIAYQCLVHLPFYMIVNFREVVAPFLILVATAGLASVVSRLQSL